MKIIQPNRIKHGYSQTLFAEPEVVFPLLCPVEEERWVPEWMPVFVASSSGTAELECIFVTPGEPYDSVWVINCYEPEKYYLEMYKVTPEHTVGKLCIKLSKSNDNETKADISYEYTSLGEGGDSFLNEFTSEYYVEFMQNWENALNHYLKTGEKIS